jgi:haloacetate dehalogenase
MLEGFKSKSIVTDDGVRIHARVAGSGPPLLMLHGFPQTHVVLTDLRGYGASDKPEGGINHVNYAKRAMARDQVNVMRDLGFSHFSVVGHDRGGRVAHRLALDHPNLVERLVVVDIVPTATMYSKTSRSFAEAYYHWFFLIQPFDLPERLVGGAPDYYLRHTLQSWCKREGGISAEALTAYIEAFTPAAIHSACEDYRASATIDLEHDQDDERGSRYLTVPLLVLWGSKGTVGKQFDVLACWREKSKAEVAGKALDCGHFVPEEVGDEMLRELLSFLR